MNYRAVLVTPGNHLDPLSRDATLYVTRGLVPGSNSTDILRHSDKGWYWRPIREGEVLQDGDAGFSFPAEALEAIEQAFERSKGAPSHARTEAAVLREWLAVERARVDEALKR